MSRDCRWRAEELEAIEVRADGRYGGPQVMWPPLPEGAVVVGSFCDPDRADPGHDHPLPAVTLDPRAWVLEVEVPDPRGDLRCDGCLRCDPVSFSPPQRRQK